MKNHILLLSCLFVLLSYTICHATNQAGFDCNKASTPTEKCICSDSDLSLKDAVLAEDYNNGMKFLSSREKNKLKSDQITWLKMRDEKCPQSHIHDVYGICIDTNCIQNMYEDRIKELKEKTIGLKRLDIKPPHDLQILLEENLSEALTGSSPAYYYRIGNHQYILEYFDGILFVDTKKKSFDTIIRGNIGESIEGAIRGGGITWLIASSRSAHQGHVSGGYQAIMVKDKNTGGEPYQLLDLAGESTLDDVMGKSNPCPDLEDEEKDFGVFSEVEGYEVKDINKDGINDMVFHIKEFDCATNKKTSIKETYYFLPQKPFIKSTVQTHSSKLPKFIPRVGHSFWIASVAFSPDGRYALSGSWDGTMKFWEIATGKEIRTFKGAPGSAVYAIAFSPDGRYALSGSGELTLWEIATGKEIKTFLRNSSTIASVAFSPDGRYLLSGLGVMEPSIKLWEVATGKEIRTFESKKTTPWGWIPLGSVNSVTFSPDGRYALSLSFNSSEMMLWDVATGKGIRTFTGHLGVVESVAFSPDGRYALSGSGDRTIKLWDVAAGKEIKTFTGHSNIVKSVAFSPDGRYALSGSGDKTIKLWDIATGKEIRTFEGHQESVNSVAFSPDGRYALSGSDDYTMKLWDINSGKEIKTFGHPPYIKDDARGKKSDAKKSQQGKVDVNAKDNEGYTPLMNESKKGNIKEVRNLLASGPDINAKSADGKTALIYASGEGYPDVVQVLLAAGADVNIKDDEGCTALIEASRYGYTDVVRELLAAKTDVNIKSNDGVTALTESSKGYDDIVKLLKEAGAKE